MTTDEVQQTLKTVEKYKTPGIEGLPDEVYLRLLNMVQICFTILKAPGVEPHHHMVYFHIQDTHWWILPLCIGAVGIFYRRSRLGYCWTRFLLWYSVKRANINFHIHLYIYIYIYIYILNQFIYHWGYIVKNVICNHFSPPIYVNRG